ncbi:MAG TPA: hypothetical protein PLO41_08965 [Rubrivivax sp.]|nr:hypothetical protein [Rubrivivax sp.]
MRAGAEDRSTLQHVFTMNPPRSQNQPPSPLTDEFDARMQALLKLRQQMRELHARLEYLRLMIRLSRGLPR